MAGLASPPFDAARLREMDAIIARFSAPGA